MVLPAFGGAPRLTGVTGNGITASYAVDGAGNRWAETINGTTTDVDLELALGVPSVLGDGIRVGGRH